MVFVNSSEAARWVAGRRIVAIDTCRAAAAGASRNPYLIAKRSALAQVRALDGAADADADGIVTLEEAFRFMVPEVQRNIERVNAVKLKGDPQHVPVTQTPVLYASPVLRAAPLAKAEPRALRLPPAQAVSR